MRTVTSWLVLGTLLASFSSAHADWFYDFDDEVLMPLSTVQSLIAGNQPPRVFYVAVDPGIDCYCRPIFPFSIVKECGGKA